MALLVVNPTATSTTPATRLVLERALRSATDLKVVETSRHGEGADIARNCNDELIIVLGGDGTVNDVATGLIDFDTGLPRGPRLAIVPGGSTNVFARALGIAPDPIEATGQLLASLENKVSRKVSIGGLTVGNQPERTFLFAAGIGVDGHTVDLVERMRRSFTSQPQGISPVRYSMAMLASLAKYVTSKDRLTITADGEERDVAIAIATTNPIWTYLGTRPLKLTPHASFDGGLGLFTVDHLTLQALTSLVSSLARTGVASAEAGDERADLVEIEITSGRALPVQADGEALRPARRIALRSLPHALDLAGV